MAPGILVYVGWIPEPLYAQIHVAMGHDNWSKQNPNHIAGAFPAPWIAFGNMGSTNGHISCAIGQVIVPGTTVHTWKVSVYPPQVSSNWDSFKYRQSEAHCMHGSTTLWPYRGDDNGNRSKGHCFITAYSMSF